jgi:GT2 family glycosyltransferase
MKRIAVCIITCNTGHLLRRCLQSVLVENPDEILVVDNGSRDGTVEMLKTEFPSVPVLALEKNIGFGAASNRGIENCRSEHIFLINADVMMMPGSLQPLNRYLESHPEAAMVGPRVLNPDKSLQTSCFYYPTPIHIFLYISEFYKLVPHVPLFKDRTLQKKSTDSSVAVPWILGAALAFRRDQILALGGFDEKFFLYFEEVDLCYRLASQNLESHFVPQAEVIHVGGGTTVQKRAWYYNMFFTSLAQFYRKHYSKILLTELVFVVKGVAFIKMVRDFLSLWMTRDETKRPVRQVYLEMHRNLVFGDWHQPSTAEPVVPA